MNKQQWTLAGGVGLGAGLMCLLDPQAGRRRRALVRDKAVHYLHQGGDTLRKASRDLGNRSRGLAAGMRSKLSRDEADDLVLCDRVRSKMGRYVSHPGAIEVTAENGVVALTGDVLASEVDRLLAKVGRIKGVRDVESRLDVHEQAADVPGLQGQGTIQARALPRNWPPAMRLLAGTAGGALAATGLRRRDAFGAALGTVGLGLLVRSLTNYEAQRLLGLGGRRGIDLQKTLHVEAPIEEVFEFWSNFENFPRFMANVLEVTDVGEGRSHWVVRGPAGSHVQWDAEITRFEPERVLAWKSVEGAAVRNAGVVHFEPGEQSGTRIHIQMTYNPPAGALGHGLASLLGSDPKRQMDEDLVRFKSLIEEGKATAKGRTVTRSEIEGAVLGPTHLH